VILFPSTSQEPHKIPAASFVPAPLFSREIFARAFLALQNHLQALSRELELLQTTPAMPAEAYGKVMQEIEQAKNVLQELKEYVTPPELRISTGSLANMVEDIVQEVARTWELPGRQTRVVCHAPLAVLRLDWKQIGKALQQVAACAYALLPTEGGEVIIEAGLRKVGPQQHLDLKIRSCGVTPLVIEEDALFRPFTWANGYQLGLSLVLAQRTVSRQHGQMFFQQISPQQSCFTLLFRA
jgi:K+-sensing histidine kinase KdpD